MKTQTISLRSEDFIRGFHFYYLTVNIREIAHQLDAWCTVDMYDPDTTSSAFGTIRKALTDNPDEFYSRTDGIKLNVRRVAYDAQSNVVTIDLADLKEDGFEEGELLYRIICKYMDELDNVTKRRQTATICLRLKEDHSLKNY